MNRRMFLGSGLALLVGCGIQSKYELDQQDKLFRAKALLNGTHNFPIVAGTLYSPLPALEEAFQKHHVAGEFIDGILSAIKAPVVFRNDELVIRYPDGFEDTTKVASDGSIDVRGFDRLQVDGKTLTWVDAQITKMYGKDVMVKPYVRKEGPSRDVFPGVSAWHELRQGNVASGLIQPDQVLHEVISQFNLGQDANYVMVVIPTDNLGYLKSNPEDIRTPQVRTVVAVGDIHQARNNMHGHRLPFGDGYVLSTLGVNPWEITRRYVREVAGLVGDVRDISGAVNDTIINLDAIGSNYDLLMHGAPKQGTGLERAVNKAALIEEGLGHINGIEGYLTGD